MSNEIEQNSKPILRPPIVVILGHVDHGKTSILDKIRQTRVADKESGGITQHIGAYQAEINGKKITFLDTPGHEAFTAIRSRGAKVADVAVLVIAAEEGLKPQTKEAIQIIKQAEIPFIVAINKIDKDSANPQRVRQELAENEVMVEDYGGQIPVVEISAKTGQGIDHLLEMINIVAELEELTAITGSPGKGVVIESHIDKQRGLLATLLVIDGEIKIGDYISAGISFGKIKSLDNFVGKPIKIATASQPCLVVGWEIAPRVGEEFEIVANLQEAEKIAAEKSKLGGTNLFTQEKASESGKKFANFIIKADVQSSLEAIDQIMKTINSEEVGYQVINFGVGNIGDNDIKNAKATGAAVVGFHVDINPTAKNSAEREKVIVRTFNIIYEMIEGVREIMSELLEPEIRQIPLGKMRILALFGSKGDGKTQIVGGKVLQGKAVRGALINVMRNNKLILTGRLGQLQQNKADVVEVSEGNDCGIRFDSITKSLLQIAVGDTLEIFQEEKIKRNI